MAARYSSLHLYPDSDHGLDGEAKESSGVDTRTLLLNGIAEEIGDIAQAVVDDSGGHEGSPQEASRQTAVFAIYGGWGTGKTTFLRDLRAKLSEKEAISTVWFNLWEHENDVQPIVALLQQAVSDLGHKTGHGVSETARAVLKTLAASLVGMGPVFTTQASGGFTSSPGFSVSNNRYYQFKKDSWAVLDDQNKREQSFREIIDALTDNRRKPIVFFIDDLDRCAPEVSAQLLERIRLYLTLPGCIFVIGAEDGSIRRAIGNFYLSDSDEEAVRIAERSRQDDTSRDEAEAAVERAIWRRKEEIGRGYLEKIVQYAFYLPALGNDDLSDFLETILGPEHNNVPPDAQAFDVLAAGLVAAHASRRQIIRTANAYTLSYYLSAPVLGPDYAPSITAFISVLQVLCPAAYAELLAGDHETGMMQLLSAWTADENEAPSEEWRNHDIHGLVTMTGLIGLEPDFIVDDKGNVGGPDYAKYLEVAAVAASPATDDPIGGERKHYRKWHQGGGKPEEWFGPDREIWPDGERDSASGGLTLATATEDLITKIGESRGVRVWIGNYQWRVLSVDAGEALLISEHVLGLHDFGEGIDDWMRERLRFDIAAAEWFFVSHYLGWLSADEAETLFKSDRDRAATNVRGTPLWWWTSTPSLMTKYRTVYTDGEVTWSGQYSDVQYGGVRPVLRLPMKPISRGSRSLDQVVDWRDSQHVGRRIDGRAPGRH